MLWLALFVGAPTRVCARPSEHVALQLTAPGVCPDAAALLERIDAQLGAQYQTDSTLRVRVSVQAIGPTDYALSLQYETEAGSAQQRLLRGESCAAVSDAAAFVLAIALSPTDVQSQAADGGVTSNAQRLPSALLGAMAELDSALLGRLSIAFGAQLGLRVGPIELRVRGQLFLPSAASQAETTTTFNAFSFDLSACVPWLVNWVTFSPCLRAELGRIGATVAGQVQEQQAGAARFQALAAGGEVRFRVVSPLWLSVGADFSWFLRRPQFVVTDLGEVGRPAEFGIRAHVGPLLAW